MFKSVKEFLKVKTTANANSSHNPDRIFGPPNAILERDCSTGPRGIGPCRMLECMCIIDDEDRHTYNWFNGICNNMMKQWITSGQLDKLKCSNN